MPCYRIDFVQVRKMAVYCNADDYESAEKWVQERNEFLVDHINLEDIQEFSLDVHRYTLYGITEDKTTQKAFDLLQGEQVEAEEQMEAVYKVLKQETEEDSTDGSTN